MTEEQAVIPGAEPVRKRERKKALTLTDEVNRLKGELETKETEIKIMESHIKNQDKQIIELKAQIEAAGNRRLAEAVVVLGRMMTEGKGE